MPGSFKSAVREGAWEEVSARQASKLAVQVFRAEHSGQKKQQMQLPEATRGHGPCDGPKSSGNGEWAKVGEAQSAPGIITRASQNRQRLGWPCGSVVQAES